jgi:hypothetical protein
MPVSFTVTRDEANLIALIAERADRELFTPHHVDQTVADTIMDLKATIAQGCPLKLKELLIADLIDFAHDVGGIRRHIDRNTGLLGDFFLPRYADTDRMKGDCREH